MVRHDALAIYLVDVTTRRVVPARTHGITQARAFPLDRLPAGMRTAVDSPKTVRVDDLPIGTGMTPTARSGLYAALRARGSLIGLIAVESEQLGIFGQQQAEVVHGLTEPFGIAIDNARMFLRIRTLAADEERSRIARDLHDHVGSSLAMIGFEVDRALAKTGADTEVEPILRELRRQVSAVVSDVRDTLYDLRTDVSDARDLTETTAEFLARVQQRSGILTHCDLRLPNRLPLVIERELWQIVREAIVNAERHSQATHLMVASRQTGDLVSLTVRDDGVGLDATNARPDSYGLVGMRERAQRLDGELSVRSLDGGGTEMRLDVHVGGGTR
jgi:signal transduction histidine kinase